MNENCVSLPFDPAARFEMPTSFLENHAALDGEELRKVFDQPFPIRRHALSELPDLVTLAEGVRTRLDGAEGAAVVDFKCLQECDIGVQKFAIFMFCSLLGTPTSLNSNPSSAIWHVSPQNPKLPGVKPMISQTDHEAELHTDSAHREYPERYVALYCVCPAADGGGRTLLADGLQALTLLRSSADGKNYEKVLRSRLLPFKTPDAISPREVRMLRATILGDEPMIRYRNDLVKSGLTKTGECLDEELSAAISGLNNAIAQSPKCDFTLAKGEMIVIDNHRLLHGRTMFNDPSRLLLRVRMER